MAQGGEVAPGSDHVRDGDLTQRLVDDFSQKRHRRFGIVSLDLQPYAAADRPLHPRDLGIRPKAFDPSRFEASLRQQGLGHVSKLPDGY